jgi:hypothetical protein
MRNYTQHIYDALVAVGRPSDARLTDLLNNVFIAGFYSELNNCHGGDESLNCVRQEAAYALTSAHTGILNKPTDFRASIRMRLIDPAASNALYDMRGPLDYWKMELQYPPSAGRGIPQLWSWRRSANSAAYPGHPVADWMEIFPKPDRNLTLTFSYYSYMVKLIDPNTNNDLVLQQWGDMFHNYLVFRCFKDMGEHGDAQQYERTFREWLQKFADWDDDLRMGEETTIDRSTRAGYNDGPLFG